MDQSTELTTAKQSLLDFKHQEWVVLAGFPRASALIRIQMRAHFDVTYSTLEISVNAFQEFSYGALKWARNPKPGAAPGCWLHPANSRVDRTALFTQGQFLYAHSTCRSRLCT